MMQPTECPDCGTEIEIDDDTEVGEVISCPSCGLELEVINISNDDYVDLQELTIEGTDWGE